MIRQIIFFLVALSIYHNFIKCSDLESLEIDSFGNVIENDDSNDIDSGRSVKLFNSFNNITLKIYWVGNEGNGIFINDIKPKSTISMNTFNGHSFYATEIENDNRRSIPHIISIQSSKDFYIFGPSENIEIRNRPHPAVTIIGNPVTAMSAKFVCLAMSGCDIYFDNGADGVFHGKLDVMKETTTLTYEGHKFYFTRKDQKDVLYGSQTMQRGQYIYEIEDPKYPPIVPHLEFMYKQKKFNEEYKNKTGLLWRSYYGDKGPRNPPILHMWPADQIGQIHHINSSHGFWNCDGDASECQSNDILNLELEVVSTHPKVFIISNFLSDFEAETIIRLAQPRLDGSLVGDRDSGGGRPSDTRTSRNSWIPRATNKQTETLFLRAADLIQVDEKLLKPFANAEDLQVVSYKNNQKYDAHHDWGVRGRPDSRFITLLLYLTDKASPTSGGETSFPLAADGLGIKVHPGKGSAVLFYNLLEDGNADELTLHSATPVREGEKWLANFWVWDPKK